MNDLRKFFITAPTEQENQENQEDEKNEEHTEKEPLNEEESLELKKQRLKEKFDANYDGSDDEGKHLTMYDKIKEEMSKQKQINRSEFTDDDPETRAQVEGYRSGQYVRIVIERFPCEFTELFDSSYPIVLGGILPSEEAFGFLQVRIKKHRWHPKILKTNDPLIFSIGWRRFQSIPVFSLNDGTRNRLLKYTPDHMHCLATFYGPISPPNTGFCAFRSISSEEKVYLLFIIFLDFLF